MKKLLLACAGILMYVFAHGQSNNPTFSTAAMPLDTNAVVYDEAGNALRYYQYTKLINTGEYTITLNGPPNTPGVKRRLRKITPEDNLRRYETIKKYIAIKSPMLQEGNELDLKQLLNAYSKEELDQKVIVLVFWSADCPPCTESFASINDFLKQIYNPQKVIVIAITRDSEEVASAKLKEKPLLYAHLLSGADEVFNSYQLQSFPSYVVADKGHIIRFAVTGSSPITIPAFKTVIRQILMQ